MAHAGTDIGGTFTDVVLHDPATGRLLVRKTPTVAAAPADGALGALDLLLADARLPWTALASFVHGTTIATNAVLQRRLARVAFVTNAGFEDLLEIGRQDRPHLYDLERRRPPPIAARDSTFGVRGRLAPDGREIEALDAAELDSLPRLAAGFDAVAVCLLHSYANDAHERALGERLRAAGLVVSLSCEVAPEFREFERASTTALNAALVPIMDRYLADLEQRLARRAPRAHLLVMESSGGVLPPAAARRRPVSTVLSGPAGGVAACGMLAKLVGEPNLVGVDVGGTSADVSLVTDGEAVARSETRIAGLPVRTPVLDIETIGAGGGSIAWKEGEFLRVGPRSAEALPGPACYGRGGVEPTLTDAQVVLGRLPDDALRAAGVEIHPALAQEAIGRLAKELGASLEEAAAAVVAVANAKMAGAIRVVTTARGHDPADFALCAFGGAGPWHAVELARELGIPRVVVPRLAGVFSALGVLAADLRHDFVRTHIVPAEHAQPAAVFEPLVARATAALDDDGVGPADRLLVLSVEARLAGQSHEVAVRARADEPASAIEARFREAYARRYGREEPRAPVELVNWRVAAIGRRPAPALPRLAPGTAAPPADSVRGVRDVRFLDEGARATPVYDASRLLGGNRLEGPALIVSEGFTFLLPPGARAEVDAWGNLRGEVGG